MYTTWIPDPKRQWIYTQIYTNYQQLLQHIYTKICIYIHHNHILTTSASSSNEHSAFKIASVKMPQPVDFQHPQVSMVGLIAKQIPNTFVFTVSCSIAAWPFMVWQTGGYLYFPVTVSMSWLQYSSKCLHTFMPIELSSAPFSASSPPTGIYFCWVLITLGQHAARSKCCLATPKK